MGGVAKNWKSEILKWSGLIELRPLESYGFNEAVELLVYYKLPHKIGVLNALPISS